MRVREFFLDSQKEIISKLVREVLSLFKVQVTEDGEFSSLSIRHRVIRSDSCARVSTELALVEIGGARHVYLRSGVLQEDERESAGIHRMVKRNLYDIFVKDLGKPPAPWGILHGVRPTKIVHRWIRLGLDEPAIVRRLREDYRAGTEKSTLITKMAFRQLPFLRTSDEKTISVYVGIPFCLTRCLYCSFPSHVLPKEEKLREFISVLRRDIETARESVRRYGFRVQNIYVGGGTPTSLPNLFFAEMLEMVYNAFYGPSVVEFTVEAGRPDSMTDEKLSTMLRLGVTRVSVNPQTMQEKTLARIGRQHTPEDAVRMFHALRKAGFPNINMDLILGLPGETAEDVEDTMKRVLALEPDDVTLHALALKRGSRLKMNLEDYELPSDEETRRMYEVAMRYIREAGMEPYYLYRQGYMSGQLENVGCCRRGAEGMYNIQIMEEHQTILGMGGAATTKVVDFRAGRLKSTFHAKDLITYLRDVEYYIKKRDALLEEVYG